MEAYLVAVFVAVSLNAGHDFDALLSAFLYRHPREVREVIGVHLIDVILIT